MNQLGSAIVEHLLLSYGLLWYGHSELLRRLSDPFWFQALGCVMGMDWHSSLITTSVMGALKRGLNRRASDLGTEKLEGFGRLDRLTRTVEEQLRPLADFAAVLERERRISSSIGGGRSTMIYRLPGSVSPILKWSYSPTSEVTSPLGANLPGSICPLASLSCRPESQSPLPDDRTR
jgi:hypothetical protein